MCSRGINCLNPNGPHLPLEAFHKCKREKGGLKNACKCCRNLDKQKYNRSHKKERKEYQIKNREHIKEYKKQYYKNNKEDLLNKQRDYIEKNKEAIKERKALYYKENKTEILKKQREYNKKHAKIIKEKAKIYRDKNKPHIKKWRKENIESIYEHNRKRRAKKLEVKENHTKTDEHYTRGLFDHKCANCGSTEDLCIDHHKPLSKGNALTRQNAVLLCRTCNCSKHDRIPEDFYDKETLLMIEKKLNTL